jgi:hypothetical protein
MDLSQSAAIAAGLAIDKNITAHDVAYPLMHERLWTAKPIVKRTR